MILHTLKIVKKQRYNLVYSRLLTSVALLTSEVNKATFMYTNYETYPPCSQQAKNSNILILTNNKRKRNREYSVQVPCLKLT